MPAADVRQQSFAGSVLSLFIQPFRIVWKLMKWIIFLILHILLIPLRFLQWLYHHLRIYTDTICHSFKCLSGLFGLICFGVIGVLAVLSVLHIGPLIVLERLWGGVDLRNTLTVMGKTLAVAGGGLIGLTVGGFLLSFLVVFVLITVYSALKIFLEVLNELTNERKKLIAMFVVAVVIFVVLYLSLQGRLL
ncbi:hypothetical protein CSB45_13910 [candidate division KSB3 bacterium]|uniref:Yip1 domain-containing protein n=1 Tax=candidate division KSB3 bacterium TaxID=2044937 RepID=A0A2G6E1J4_9BACT|nr:MAG: hypothetical protein CSB45_13910 [candidate division KSB3 bacterium]PIE28497.1 MAG: hypothetical protein CSA57_13405 [candidate division KSB3 bacterium]